MTRLVMFFLLGVIAGGIGMKLQEQRVERAERRMAAARAVPANATKIAKAVAVASKDRREARSVDDSPLPQQEVPRAEMEKDSADTRETKRVPVPEAIQPLMRSTYDGTTLAELHEKLEREPKDDAWSYQKEQDLSEFFVPAHGTTRFEVHSIECRTTMCEVQALALGPTQHNTVMEDLQREPWWDFSRSFTRFGEHNGSTSVVLYLLRDS